MDNIIGAAWRGNQASGMSTGQFNEFLRAMQRTFEDGISKGFVRGANEMAGNFTYLAALGGGSELYKGEAGANVMQKLSSGIEGATSLSSVNDILTYRAAQSVVDRWKNGDEREREKYRSLFDLDPTKDGYEAGDPDKASDWYAANLLMNRGFTPEVFDGQMKNFGIADMGDFESILGRIMSQYSMNAGQAGFLYNAWKDNKGKVTLSDYEKAMTIQSPAAPASGSVELDYAKQTQAFATALAEFGQKEFSVKVVNLPELIKTQKERIYNEINADDTSEMTKTEALAARESEYNEALRSGDAARTRQAAVELEKARSAMINPDYGALDSENIEIQHGRVRGLAGSDFFSTGSLFKTPEQKADAAANNQLYNILDSAVKSKDETQMRQATTVMNILDQAPKDIRAEWDRNNTLNAALAESKGIGDLLSALERLITVTEQNGQAHYTFRQED